jgi:glycerol-3-phosphate acyltransferase PlsX
MNLETAIGIDAHGGDPYKGTPPYVRIARAVEIASVLHPETTFFVAGSPAALQSVLRPTRTIKPIQGDDPKYGAAKILSKMAAKGDISGFVTLSKTEALVPCVHKYIGSFESCTYAFPSLNLMPLLAELPKARSTGEHKSCYMLDVGAMPQVSAENYVAYAHIGRIYARLVGKRRPARIGLLSIGAEKRKGSEAQREAYGMLEQLLPANGEGDVFVGNVEPEPCIFDKDNGMHDPRPVDVVVTGGERGNDFIKIFAAAARYAFEELSYEINHGPPWEQAGGMLIRGAGRRVKERATKYGVATFPCSNKPVRKGHGKTPVEGILECIDSLLRAIASNETGRMRHEINSYARYISGKEKF